MRKKRVNLYIDGACSGNPGIGAWSCVHYDAETNTIYKAYMGKDDREETTNNRMELRGLLAALKLATTTYKDCDVVIYCDSAYVVNIFNEWIYSWAKNNWINSSKQEVKNLDLIKELYEYIKIDFPNFGVYKIIGHNNEIGNELADAYAVAHRSGIVTKLVKIIKENNITLDLE